MGNGSSDGELLESFPHWGKALASGSLSTLPGLEPSPDASLFLQSGKGHHTAKNSADLKAWLGQVENLVGYVLRY